MAESISINFSFELKFACEVRISATSQDYTGLATPAPLHDSKEVELSPVGQQMQARARERVKHRRSEHEVEADDESLYLLEASAAANSMGARIKDRESLGWLLCCTKRLEKSCKSFTTPARTSFWPQARHFKGMKGTPLSFSPPFSTPSKVRRVYEEDRKSGNEFEDHLARDCVGSQKGAANEGRQPRNSFSALLQSSKSSKSEASPTKEEQSTYIQREVQSFFDLIAQVEKKDREDELLADAVDSPIPSPTSSIKHVRRSSQDLGANDSPRANDSVGISDGGEMRPKSEGKKVRDSEDEWEDDEDEQDEDEQDEDEQDEDEQGEEEEEDDEDIGMILTPDSVNTTSPAEGEWEVV